jgi:hypothetical protein
MNNQVDIFKGFSHPGLQGPMGVRDDTQQVAISMAFSFIGHNKSLTAS